MNVFSSVVPKQQHTRCLSLCGSEHADGEPTEPGAQRTPGSVSDTSQVEACYRQDQLLPVRRSLSAATTITRCLNGDELPAPPEIRHFSLCSGSVSGGMWTQRLFDGPDFHVSSMHPIKRWSVTHSARTEHHFCDNEGQQTLCLELHIIYGSRYMFCIQDGALSIKEQLICFIFFNPIISFVFSSFTPNLQLKSCRFKPQHGFIFLVY